MELLTNILLSVLMQAVRACLEPFVYEWTRARRGSISAEHGIGQLKRNALHYSATNEAMDLMRKIKHLMDPNGIMNPGKVL
jgi:FAD/FMN-containing dehydrogenase